jgi:hypothetical protein
MDSIRACTLAVEKGRRRNMSFDVLCLSDGWREFSGGGRSMYRRSE